MNKKNLMLALTMLVVPNMALACADTLFNSPLMFMIGLILQGVSLFLIIGIILSLITKRIEARRKNLKAKSSFSWLTFIMLLSAIAYSISGIWLFTPDNHLYLLNYVALFSVLSAGLILLRKLSLRKISYSHIIISLLLLATFLGAFIYKKRQDNIIASIISEQQAEQAQSATTPQFNNPLSSDNPFVPTAGGSLCGGEFSIF